MPPIVFCDNINYTVKDENIAALLTATTWEDRVLGKTATAAAEVVSTFLFAGNNLRFSHELMRRNVPIRLDANEQNPSLDRATSDFKHFPLQPWLQANRPKLVWACHTIIQSWVAKGQPTGNVVFHSFDAYAGVMSGILENAGITGFLNNRADYLGNQDEDEDGTLDFIKALWKAHRMVPFTIDDMLTPAKAPVTEGIMFGLPIANGHAHRQLTDMGAFAKQQLNGRTFRVGDPPQPGISGAGKRVKMVRRTKGSPVKYGFLEL